MFNKIQQKPFQDCPICMNKQAGVWQQTQLFNNRNCKICSGSYLLQTYACDPDQCKTLLSEVYQIAKFNPQMLLQ